MTKERRLSTGKIPFFFFNPFDMVKYITIDGKKRPFYYSYGALKKFCQDTDKTLTDFSEALTSMGFEEIESLMFRGFEAGALKEGQKVDFTVKDMEPWLDTDFSLIEKCTAALGDFFGGADQKQPKKKR